jgi:hypothetical protein
MLETLNKTKVYKQDKDGLERQQGSLQLSDWDSFEIGLAIMRNGSDLWMVRM